MNIKPKNVQIENYDGKTSILLRYEKKGEFTGEPQTIGMRIWNIDNQKQAEDISARIGNEIIRKEKEIGVLVGVDMNGHSVYAIRLNRENIEFEKCNITK